MEIDIFITGLLDMPIFDVIYVYLACGIVIIARAWPFWVAVALVMVLYMVKPKPMTKAWWGMFL